MDIKDLKSAWDTYSSQEVSKRQLEKGAIDEMLRKKSVSLVDRIDRNLRIGMGILLAYIAYTLLENLFLTKILIQEPLEYPKWLYPIDMFSNALIVTTYLFFAIRYLKIRKSFSIDNQLKALLTGILDTLKTYRRMFYLAVIILLLNIAVSFSAGLYQGVKSKADLTNSGLENLPMSKIYEIIGVGSIILIPIITVTFLILRWGFNKLYGKYLNKLNDTLDELDEKDELSD